MTPSAVSFETEDVFNIYDVVTPKMENLMRDVYWLHGLIKTYLEDIREYNISRYNVFIAPDQNASEYKVHLVHKRHDMVQTTTIMITDLKQYYARSFRVGADEAEPVVAGTD